MSVTSSHARTFTIFGAGLSGALMAVALARRGHRVELYERRADPRKSAAERGRSINLALSTRGIEALREVGLAEEVLASAIPMRGRMIHPRRGDIAFQAYSKGAALAINSVSRSGLNELLLSAAEREPPGGGRVTIRFNHRCVGMDLDTGRAEVLDGETGRTVFVDTETVIAADGAFSAVRGSMQKRDRFDCSQSYLEHGYKELTIPPGAGGKHLIDRNALHIWPRGTFMMIALPNLDGSFTCTLFWPYSGANSFSAMPSGRDALAFFEREFPDAVPLIPNLVDDWEHNPVASLVTIRCSPWNFGSRAVLLGDAAHAVVPFYGQGMNASFEDCTVLARYIDESRGDLAAAYAKYAAERKPNTDALAELAVENFIEMRDKAGSAAFRRKKKLEHFLEDTFPQWYTSLYHMVTFSTVPYAEARRKAASQDRVIRRATWGLLAVVAGVVKLGAVIWVTHVVTKRWF